MNGIDDFLFADAGGFVCLGVLGFCLCLNLDVRECLICIGNILVFSDKLVSQIYLFENGDFFQWLVLILREGEFHVKGSVCFFSGELLCHLGSFDFVSGLRIYQPRFSGVGLSGDEVLVSYCVHDILSTALLNDVQLGIFVYRFGLNLRDVNGLLTVL